MATHIQFRVWQDIVTTVLKPLGHRHSRVRQSWPERAIPTVVDDFAVISCVSRRVVHKGNRENIGYLNEQAMTRVSCS